MIYLVMESDIEYIIEQPISPTKQLYDAYKVEPNITYLEEDLDNLPGNLQIFTLPITTFLSGCNFNIMNIFNYFPLSLENIISIQTDSQIRTLRPHKKHLKYDSTIDNFMHQITAIMCIFTTRRGFSPRVGSSDRLHRPTPMRRAAGPPGSYG